MTCSHVCWMLPGVLRLLCIGQGCECIVNRSSSTGYRVDEKYFRVFHSVRTFHEMYGFHQEILQKTIGTGTFSPTTHPTTHQQQLSLPLAGNAICICNSNMETMRFQCTRPTCGLAAGQDCLGDPNGSTFILGIYMLQFAPGIVSQSLEACGGGCCDVVLRWLCLC